jgi:hypothetical protein
MQPSREAQDRAKSMETHVEESAADSSRFGDLVARGGVIACDLVPLEWSSNNFVMPGVRWHVALLESEAQHFQPLTPQ